MSQSVLELEVGLLQKSLKVGLWRERAARKLAQEVQADLRRRQNPVSCKKSGKLLCKLANDWGFAAGVHEILWCFVSAYYTNRTVIMDTKNWSYLGNADNQELWTTIFRPISKCTLPQPDVGIDAEQDVVIESYPSNTPNSECSSFA